MKVCKIIWIDLVSGIEGYGFGMAFSGRIKELPFLKKSLMTAVSYVYTIMKTLFSFTLIFVY
jgi:hypothetical protein